MSGGYKNDNAVRFVAGGGFISNSGDFANGKAFRDGSTSDPVSTSIPVPPAYARTVTPSFIRPIPVQMPAIFDLASGDGLLSTSPTNLGEGRDAKIDSPSKSRHSASATNFCPRRVSNNNHLPPHSQHSGSGQKVTLSEIIHVPVDKFPKYNFVGRILGPRGMTAKQLEDETGCKIMVRGRGSSRMYQGSRTDPDMPLHVQIQVEDFPEPAKLKMDNAITRIKQLLNPPPEGRDELKRKQLVELSIINGTYRPSTATKVLLRKIGGYQNPQEQLDFTCLIDPTRNLNPLMLTNITACDQHNKSDENLAKMQELFAMMAMRRPYI
ncbi:hypothetical protein WR25_25353 [Diploscapter pachys]|uniref:K Homology domain-containing protein n=1 Tax=Diploscapter pachys TaxID=2018661 RepID=A0A2A2JRH3_9BILA|nr:hypothetical protein WR25_25353 [Diploscapter pachys]